MTQGTRGGRRRSQNPPPRRPGDPRTRVRRPGNNRKYGVLETYGPARYKRDVELPRRGLLDLRRRDAVALKLQGLSLEQIGRRLHADPSMNSEKVGYPGGYGWRNLYEGKPPVTGRSLQSLVANDVREMLEHARLSNEVVRQEGLQLTIAKLEEAAAALWPKVKAGNPRAQEVWLTNLDKQIELQGIEPGEMSLSRIGPGATGAQEGWDKAFVKGVFETLRSIGAQLGPTSNAELIAANDAAQQAREVAEAEEIADAEIVE